MCYSLGILQLIVTTIINNNNLHIFQQVCFFREYLFLLSMNDLRRDNSEEIKI